MTWGCQSLSLARPLRHTSHISVLEFVLIIIFLYSIPKFDIVMVLILI